VLKKIFKAVTAFILLVGCYLGYVRAFAVVVEQFRASRRIDINAFAVTESKSKREAIELAKSHFGRGHWSANEELTFRYYNYEQGFWMYAKEVVRVVEQDGVKYDGKRVTMAPFALIWQSPDGKSAKTVLSDRAVFDLNEPVSLNINPGGKALRIKHAWIQENVLIRDNHGTPEDPSDDMNIGPLTAVEYDEPTLQIRSESDVVIQDRDIRVTGQGMMIQLRSKDETAGPSHSSAGFQGAETLYLYKKVHVVMRDVGKSGILPGSVQTRRVAPGEVQVQAQIASRPDQKQATPTAANEPTPMDVWCDSTMRVDMPKPQTPVLVGPPEPPAPTLVGFERNVVVLRGPVDSLRDQLTCDTLKLTMVPGDKAPKSGTESKTQSESRSSAEPNTNEDTSPFGGLTLQRAVATGYAVWLYLPANGVKLRCNELFHTRSMPFKPDLTYFRGDPTRPIELWKIDVVRDEGPDQGKVTSATYIRTQDATMFDRGTGLDTANVIARGPGIMETRPDRNQPVERRAIWQDRLHVDNQLGPDGRVKQKIIVLSGSRPCFFDVMKKTSLDSASTIWVWLKPKPPTAREAGASPTAAAGFAAPGTTAATPIIVASNGATAPPTSSTNTRTSTGDHRGANADPGGGSFQIDRLVALRDVHLLAPSKTMTARERLDADFVDAEPAAVVSAPTTKTESIPNSPARNADQPQAQNPNQSLGQGQGQGPGSKPSSEPVAAQNPEETQPTDPPMTGSAERIWAKVVQAPGSSLGSGSGKRTTGTKTAAGPESNAEVREVRMWGNAAVHQDPAAGKIKGQEATGEAIYLENRGPGKVHTIVYQRDPTEKIRRPDPLPRARAENDDNKITVAGFLTMNQETDQVWANGPGTMTQLAAPGFMTDKAPDAPADAQTPRDGAAQSKPKPKTRAGVPLSEKVPMTITFTERMEFNGRTTDPDGHPSARADFFGISTAKMEDSKLYCEEQMITFTDKEVPLAQVGATSKGPSKPKAGSNALDPANEDVGADGEAEAEPQTKAELARIYCYKNAVAINRKVDPDSPTLIQMQKIYAQDSLIYDHRTGDFEVPDKGLVWLFDRDNKSTETNGQDLDGNGNSNNAPNRTATRRTVTPTSGRAPSQSGRTGGAPATATRSRSTARPTPPPATTKPKTAEVPPLVLTQIYFVNGMMGQVGSGKAINKSETRWSQFFGDIEVCRAQVPTERSILDPDKLPRDGFFLTGQTLRVITEPPPATAPPSTPARNYLKAWDRARVTSVDKTLGADVITYDTYKDLFYAYGEQGRSVIFGDQHAPGQDASFGSGKAVQFNPKTGQANGIDSNSWSALDKKTGVRPAPAWAPDPYAKPKKPYKRPYRTAPTNVDRRNFDAQ
jgi:hypothetical protein